MIFFRPDHTNPISNPVSAVTRFDATCTAGNALHARVVGPPASRPGGYPLTFPGGHRPGHLGSGVHDSFSATARPGAFLLPARRWPHRTTRNHSRSHPGSAGSLTPGELAGAPYGGEQPHTLKHGKVLSRLTRNAASSSATRIMGLDRIVSPSRWVVLAAVTERRLRRPARGRWRVTGPGASGSLRER